MIYIDTSALVRRYVLESGSADILRMVRKGDDVATSELAYPELLSALVRRSRAGDISLLILRP